MQPRLTFANLDKTWLDAFVTDVVLTFLKNMFGEEGAKLYRVHSVAEKVHNDLVSILQAACTACLSTGHVQLRHGCFDVLKLRDADQAEAVVLREIGVWVRRAFDELGIVTGHMPDIYFHLPLCA
jgi:hypothetical protein